MRLLNWLIVKKVRRHPKKNNDPLWDGFNHDEHAKELAASYVEDLNDEDLLVTPIYREKKAKLHEIGEELKRLAETLQTAGTREYARAVVNEQLKWTRYARDLLSK